MLDLRSMINLRFAKVFQGLGPNIDKNLRFAKVLGPGPIKHLRFAVVFRYFGPQIDEISKVFQGFHSNDNLGSFHNHCNLQCIPKIMFLFSCIFQGCTKKKRCASRLFVY